MSFCCFYIMEGNVMIQADGLILAGGKSSRMGGHHKGSLTYRDETFTEILVRELKKEVQTVWLSYGREIRTCINGCRIVRDIYDNSGPIGGIHAGLAICGSDILFVTACDMPFLRIDLFYYLYEELSRKEISGCSTERPFRYDGCVPMADGRIHPLASIYRKSAGKVLDEQIRDKNYCLRDALRRLHILYLDVTGERRFVRMLQNINTTQEYEMLRDE